jgi:hypothetical protein
LTEGFFINRLNDTGGKVTAGVVDTVGLFTAGVIDASDIFTAGGTAINVDLRKDVTAGVADSGGKFGRYQRHQWPIR